MSRNPARTVERGAYAHGRFAHGQRVLPEEVPVAFSFQASTHAVMMASPSDLEDFAHGFCLSEGIISSVDEIVAVEPVGVDGGIDLRIRLKPEIQAALTQSQRKLAGPVGCGLCGVDSIEAALKDVPQIESDLRLSPADIALAGNGLKAAQRLNAKVHAVHGAGFYVPGQGVVLAREDVGRHNALDKLVGAMAREGIAGESGALVISSRVSIELVQKAARAGISVLIAVSAPTALAVETADACGLTLIGIARGEEFEVFTHPRRIGEKRTSHVA
jgi:FdhD protein